MPDWIERLLQTETLPGNTVRLMNYFFRTHMSWPWLVAYGVLLAVSWGHLSIGWRTTFTISGGVIFVFTMCSLVQEPIALHRLRNALNAFYYACDRDGLWNEASQASPETRQRLQVLQDAVRWFSRWLLPFSRRR